MVRMTPDIWADPRFCTLQESLGWGRAQTLGTLMLAWDATRCLDKASLSAAEVCAALGGASRDKPVLLQALLDAGYLRPCPDAPGTFEFPDNTQRVSLSRVRAAAARVGHEANRRKRRGRPFVPVDERPVPPKRVYKKRVRPGQAEGEVAAAPAKEAAPPKPPKPEKPYVDPALAAIEAARKVDMRAANLEAWNAYAEAYVKRYGVAPLRNARTNGMVAQFVKRVGREPAPAVLRFYLAHNGREYGMRQHDFGLALRDAEAMHTQWMRGEATTASTLKDSEGRSRLEGQLFRLGQLHVLPSG